MYMLMDIELINLMFFYMYMYIYGNVVEEEI